MKSLNKKSTYGKYASSIIFFLILVFLFVGAITAYLSNGYLSPLWRIAECNWKPPGENYVMAECDPIISPFYRLGSLYLDVDPKLTAALRKADVVITGNSRTLYTFAVNLRNNPIEEYFRKKNLKAFIVAEEGSGFRFRKMVLEKLKIHPKIALINTEDLAADLLEDDNKELIFNQDRFKLPFKIIHFSIEMQHSICTSKKQNLIMKKLKDFYCHGLITPSWRSLSTGVVAQTNKRIPTNRQLITMTSDTHIDSIDIFRRRMHTMFKSKAWRDSCVIFYEIPNPNQFFEVSTQLAREAEKPFIFPSISPEKSYFVFDGSHMEKDTAIRWTNEFLQILDPYLNKCLAKSYA
ncbi:TPA: hypothetical protein ACGG5K_001542 [Legionella pneumophila]|uniref:hypothetical protein n=1 Tax=Legionella pneumophila TaxID=446 RepID=UPI0004824665|nr:hypothetical protein [Legionella pneumophila]RYW93387.1 hypothetical protein D7217_03630 [Legionella pneumophila]STX98266.1 Uncharacterised protein [Legionella pneumophila]HAT1774466.1 hypothetical protein [Legionella pneumophila]HAT1777169.1 hypothetical protein [Legionella pneumophila]HAT2017656.1 hypothetical protein [Legionella pneumophila]